MLEGTNPKAPIVVCGMKMIGSLILVLLVLTGCSGSTSADVDPTQEPVETTTSTATPVTTTTLPPDTTTLPPTTPTEPIAPPELTLDAVLSGPFAPWHSVAVESPELQVSGSVTPGSQVVLMVTSPPTADGEIVFEGTATVEDGYFYGDVTLAPGRSIVAVIATESDGTVSALNLDARYEPEASVEFGFLTRVSASEIVADYAQWLSGEEANQAAFEDGVIATVEEGVPNDYYIRNVNPQLRTLRLADEVAVWLVSPAAGVATIQVELDEWLALFNDGAPWDYETDVVPIPEPPHGGYFGAGTVHAPYWLVVLDGEVIAIEQQYIP